VSVVIRAAMGYELGTLLHVTTQHLTPEMSEIFLVLLKSDIFLT
jgi:hypothetical protein